MYNFVPNLPHRNACAHWNLRIPAWCFLCKTIASFRRFVEILFCIREKFTFNFLESVICQHISIAQRFLSHYIWLINRVLNNNSSTFLLYQLIKMNLKRLRVSKCIIKVSVKFKPTRSNFFWRRKRLNFFRFISS